MSNASDEAAVPGDNTTLIEKAAVSSSAAKKTVGDAEPETADVAKAASADDGYIRLRVITSDDNSEVHFRVKLHTPMGRLKRSYSSKMGQQLEELRFVFEGHRITDEETAASLQMVNDDVIEIYQQRMGGSV